MLPDISSLTDNLPLLTIVAIGVIGILIVGKLMKGAVKLVLSLVIIALVCAAVYFLVFWYIPGNLTI